MRLRAHCFSLVATTFLCLVVAHSRTKLDEKGRGAIREVLLLLKDKEAKLVKSNEECEWAKP